MNIFLLFPNGKEKAFTLSYDDGVDTDIRFIELMQKYRIKGTFNLNSGLFVPEDRRRQEGQIHFTLPRSITKNLYDNPLCEVATHGNTHANLKLLNEAQCLFEIMSDRNELEDLFNCIVRGHAYPYGIYSEGVIDTLQKAGIAYARTIDSHRTFKLPDNWMKWSPTCHHNDKELFDLADSFLSGNVGNSDGWLFYLWGHTYEFRRDNNWEVIERLFEKISDNKNVWYATNIELYEYVNAYKSLVYSLDSKTVYNPAGIDVWIKKNNEKICVPAAQTVEI